MVEMTVQHFDMVHISSNLSTMVLARNGNHSIEGPSQQAHQQNQNKKNMVKAFVGY